MKPRPCKPRHPDPAATAATCRLCYLMMTDAKYAAAWGEPTPANTAARPVARPRVVSAKPSASPYLSPPCVNEGVVLEVCGSCAGRLGDVRVCTIHGRCTRKELGKGDRACATCPDYLPSGVRDRPLYPTAVRRITAADLGHEPDVRVSNAAILKRESGWLLAYRHSWLYADVWTAPLDDRFRPAGPSSKLDLHHPLAAFGREDPRLFTFRGAPHVAFAGIATKFGPARQLYARLTPDGAGVAAVYAPRFRDAAWEKNIGFFGTPDGLRAVYSISPRHVVFAVDGDRAEVVSDVPYAPKWSGGSMRGGASPALRGGRYYNWFHGKDKRGTRVVYTTGAYTFDAATYAPGECTPTPVMEGDEQTKPRDEFLAGILNWYPCGAVPLGGDWYVSAGAHDTWVEIASWPVGTIDAALRA